MAIGAIGECSHQLAFSLLNSSSKFRPWWIVANAHMYRKILRPTYIRTYSKSVPCEILTLRFLLVSRSPCRPIPIVHDRTRSRSRPLEAPAAATGAFPEEARQRQPRHHGRDADRRQERLEGTAPTRTGAPATGQRRRRPRRGRPPAGETKQEQGWRERLQRVRRKAAGRRDEIAVGEQQR